MANAATGSRVRVGFVGLAQAGIGLAAGVLSAGFGLRLADWDPSSVAIVLFAIVVWCLFVGSLWKFHRALGTAVRSPDDPHLLMPPLLPAGQPVLISIGLFGTFLGLSYGLMYSIPCIDPNAAGHAACIEEIVASGTPPAEAEAASMQYGMSKLLSGARLAFSKSVAGIGLGLSYMILFRLAERASVVARRRSRREHPEPDPVVAELRLLREAQPDPRPLREAAESLAHGSEALKAVAEGLRSLTADAIAREVAAGVRDAVDQRLAPTLQQISDELKILHDMKRDTDKAVQQQLKDLVQELREQALAPMAAQIERTNEVTRDVAGSVTRLSASVDASADAVRRTSEQTGQLTHQLEQFQVKALADLNQFAGGLGQTLDTFTTDSSISFREMGDQIQRSVDAACGGMEAQRAAFESSAEAARSAFSTQTETIRVAGQTAATEIRSAGEAARDALQMVRGEFAEALSDQRASLQGVLDALEGAFQQDLEHRQEFERLTEQAVRRVELLLTKTAAMEGALAQTTPTLLAEVARSIQDLGKVAAEQHERATQLELALASHLELSAENHRTFMKEEDEHLREVLHGIGGLVGAIAETTREVEQTRTRARVQA